MISFTNHLELEFQRSVLCKSNNLDEMHDFRSLSLQSFLESAYYLLIIYMKIKTDEILTERGL